MTTQAIKNILKRMRTNQGDNIGEISESQPVMLIFLRHFGCTFCREALAELSWKRKLIEQKGTRLIFVHMTDEETADKYFNRYNLEGVEHISDPSCQYYTSFGLLKGTFKQLFGLSTWIRGFEAGILEGHAAGKQMGDDFQMPGVFLLHNREIKEHYIHRLASDKPNYEKLAECCVI